MPLSNFIKSLVRKTHSAMEGFRPLDFTLVVLVFLATITAIIIIITYVFATQTKLSFFKTPIPLTSREYAKGDTIQGYFDGRKLYDGRVEIVRQLSCNDGYIETLPNIKTGEDHVDSIQPARVIDGNYSRSIAMVPDEVKAGSSCIVTFNHLACVPYLFGCYNVEYSYVSLPFTVLDWRDND